MSDGLNRVQLLGKVDRRHLPFTDEHKRKLSASRLDDLTGRRFGRLLVLSRSDNDRQGKPMWLCNCDCGKSKPIRATVLRGGYARSCGCLALEEVVIRSVSHGMTNSREWETWHRMKQRCSEGEPTERNRHYGARGIRVCDRWKHSFEAFFADMGPRPGPGYSIERIDSDGNYEPGNCVWATIEAQNRNKRNNVKLTAFGRTQLAADWARELGASQTTINDRLVRGWSVEAAVSEPVSKSRRNRRHS